MATNKIIILKLARENNETFNPVTLFSHLLIQSTKGENCCWLKKRSCCFFFNWHNWKGTSWTSIPKSPPPREHLRRGGWADKSAFLRFLVNSSATIIYRRNLLKG